MEECRRRKEMRDQEMAQLEAEEAAMEQAMEEGLKTKEEKPQDLEKGTVVFDEGKGEKEKEKWIVEQKLGEGAFGTVYLVDGKGKKKAAMKTEKKKGGGVLKMEREAMAALKGRPNTVQIFDSGVWGTYLFLVMTLVGPDLRKVKEWCQEKGEMAEELLLVMWIRALAAMKEVHESGYVHRDLKDENLCLARASDFLNVYIVDFGMARKYVTEAFGALRLRRPRASPAFRGNQLNASRRAHSGQDVSRGDDVEALYYTFLGLSMPLPWSGCSDPSLIRIWKSERMPEVLKKASSPVFERIWKIIDNSTFTSRPQYAELFDVLMRRLTDLKGRLLTRPSFFDAFVQKGLLDGPSGAKLPKEEDEKKRIRSRLQRTEVGDGEAHLAPMLEDFFGIQKPKKQEKEAKKKPALPSSTAAQNKTSRRRRK